ncbi:hypothetical protein [Bradyrhizobium betae]|uniref:Uncharacterized protein n=1 Tax=Bradyrhizobium betae TaxID=244734 RepID=A0A5P6NZA3_9BRAD|nr:hypothetical protein [Bradyrhizobium betae]MCS3725461.1 hypothetical protein [Bradyrhizobium betae]QFI71246.1 hypothetical protein F8237_01965 [Bradyrhizobium betae]
MSFRSVVAPQKRYALKMTYSPYLDRAKLRGKEAIEQMANDFLMFAASAGSVNQDDLELLGWTRTQVVLHTSDARHLANHRADQERRRVFA